MKHVNSGNNSTYRRAYIENHDNPQGQAACLRPEHVHDFIYEFVSRVGICTEFKLFPEQTTYLYQNHAF